MASIRTTLAAGLAGMIALSACTAVVVEEGPGPRPRPPRPEPEFACPQIYAPVCGIRRGRLVEFDNDCIAVNSGYSVLGPGSCRRYQDAGVRPRPPREPQFCTREYEPVCGENPRTGALRTFGNVCEARNAGARVLYPGRC